MKIVLNLITKFEAEEFEVIASCFKYEFVKKEQTLLSRGAICNKFYFVADGCLRIFFTDSKGVEKTRYIMSKNYIGTALTSFITRKPSFEEIGALNDTHVLSISHQNFYKLNDQLKKWKDFYQTILEMAYIFQNQKIENLMTKSAKERFDQTIRETPELFQTVSNRILASYLDMTSETLTKTNGFRKINE